MANFHTNEINQRKFAIIVVNSIMVHLGNYLHFFLVGSSDSLPLQALGAVAVPSDAFGASPFYFVPLQIWCCHRAKHCARNLGIQGITRYLSLILVQPTAVALRRRQSSFQAADFGDRGAAMPMSLHVRITNYLAWRNCSHMAMWLLNTTQRYQSCTLYD